MSYFDEVRVKQSILSSTDNSTTTNLASSATFTGTAEETFGINGIQVYHYSDQPCTIYLDQSLDGTNWDVVDQFACLASTAYTETLISVAPYYRARVTNTGSLTTTVMRFATGMTPIINPLPRTLTEDARLKTETTLVGKENTGRHVFVSPTNTLNVNSNTRLIGTNFDGSTKDPNFWTETVTGTGSVAQAGKITLATGVTANSTAQYETVRRARFVVGYALRFLGLYCWTTVGETDNVRRCGAYDTNDGWFFQLDGSTFSIGIRSATVDTLVNSGSFNGNKGVNFAPVAAEKYRMEIEWTPFGASFYIDGTLLHSIKPADMPIHLSLPARMENINSGGNTSDVSFVSRGSVVLREGELKTNATYKYITGVTTTVLKRGAGQLHTIVNNDNAGTLTIYDGESAAGVTMAVIDLVKVLGTLTFDAPFSDGLTIALTGATAKITVVYE
ncbi:MAG: hypothetical protein KAH01_07730 [Caldisericia bacterium]|nr:hypothetical protein [Caldisericia bacterium]